jgi:hypothetical protein
MKDVPVQAVSLEHLRTHLREERSPFVLRTSDRILFRKCRRLWGWMSHNRQGRVLRESADYLWFGTGIHYALEDYHGLNLYGHPAKAFLAYVYACATAKILPGTWQEHQEMGLALMSYYADEWLRYRPALQTYEHPNEQGVLIPQVEINGSIDLGVRTKDGRRVLYGFTMDRMVIDEYGRLWIAEYKTAKQLRIYHFDVDEQITSYMWAAWRLSGVVPAGVIYMQFVKKIPALPKILASGKVSCDTRQATSAALYAKMLEDMYGHVENAPPENIVCLNKYRAMEDEDKDKFIVRHRVERNLKQLESFERKVLMELEDICNPDLPLYPNPTKDCEYMCPMQAACVAMDDGSDWENTLGQYSIATGDVMTQREKEQMQWRNLLPEPNQVQLPAAGVQYQQLLGQLQPQDQEVSQPPEELFLEELGMR